MVSDNLAIILVDHKFLGVNRVPASESFWTDLELQVLSSRSHRITFQGAIYKKIDEHTYIQDGTVRTDLNYKPVE
jgi:hypothetical protein